MTRLGWLVLLLSAGCRHVAPAPTPSPERYRQLWSEWTAELSELPVCLVEEWSSTPRELAAPLPGETVHLQGQLTVVSDDCSDAIQDLLLRGARLPEKDTQLSPQEAIDALFDESNWTCASVLGMRVGKTELLLLPDGKVFRRLPLLLATLLAEQLATREAIVWGVADSARRDQVGVRLDRLCLRSGVTPQYPTVPDTEARRPAVDAFERLAEHAELPALLREAAARVAAALRERR